MAPQWRTIEPAWVNEAGEIQTWLATVPIVLFMYVRFHHVDRVKRQFDGELPVPLDPVNLDGFLGATARGDDRWWPDELAYWYGLWRNRMSRDHQIQIMPTRHPGWPNREYTDWWAVACRQRIACCKIPGDFSCRVMCPQLRLRREIRSSFRAMPPPAEDGRRCSALISGGRVRGQPAVGGWIRSRAGTMRTRRQSTLDRRTFRRGVGTRIRGRRLRDTRPGPRLLLRHGCRPGSVHGVWRGLRIRIRVATRRPGGPSHRYGPTSDMYELFSCGEQTMDQIAHGYVVSRATDDEVYRPSPPLQPRHDHSQPCQGFQYYQPSQQSFLHTLPQ
ncbi:hypothetical protein PIB30_041471 [Stylosanthes scabra]|uniref:Aminotransferase-like plant mobile domain-containing protein n=1 Tax=Stylosanthes scabra TaxID=79078 RepID=A0ABU6QF06_9FABA|nr:hypothetical protein [Stylosanthes scabra]